MILPKNPIARILAVVLALLVGVGAVGCLLVMLLLIFVSLEDPHRREVTVATTSDVLPARYRTADLYLRNRTAAPLQVRVVAPRAAVQLDSIWWALPQFTDVIGRAVMLRDGFAVGGLRYQAERTLVLGSVDTLIDVHYPNPLPRALARCRRIDIRYSPALNSNRTMDGDLNYERVVRVQRLPRQPQSLLLTLYLVPGDTLALGHYSAAAAGPQLPGPPPLPEMPDEAVPPAIVVQWQDAQGHAHQHRPRLAYWLQKFAPAAPPTGPQQVRHYLDYPLNHTTILVAKRIANELAEKH